MIKRDIYLFPGLLPPGPRDLPTELKVWRADDEVNFELGRRWEGGDRIKLDAFRPKPGAPTEVEKLIAVLQGLQREVDARRQKKPAKRRGMVREPSFTSKI